MADEVVYTEAGRTYRVTGVHGKAQAVFSASQEMETLIERRISAARRALGRWRGPHAGTFGEELNGVLSKMASLKVTLSSAHRTLASFPDKPAASWAAVRQNDEVHMGARVEVTVEPGTVSAQTGELRAYTTEASGQDPRLATLAGAVNLDGISATVTYQRPLNPAERQRLIDGGADPREIAGETVGQTEPVAPSTLITLPTPSEEVAPIVSASGELNAFTLAVASAIDNADTAALALLARDPAALLDRMNWLRQDPRRWNQLTPLEQQLLIESLPDQIGSLNGLPIAARDRANRIVLDRTRAALQARLSYLRSLPEVTTPQPTPQPSPRPGGAPPTLLPADEIAQIESKLRGIEALERRLAGVPGRPQAYLVGLSGEGNGQAIVAIGDPDHADNVVTYVPGTGSSLGKISGDINRADAMALDAYGRSPGSRTAVITWVGYDAPQSLIEATSSSYADQGAGDLRSFQAGLGVSHVGGDANYTVVGHSYGSTVIGHAARAGDLGADNLVFVGSPGVGVDHASDLNIDPRHVYATVAANDPIQYGTVHGPDPTRPGFGAQPFASDAGSPSAHAHSEYWDVGNRSRANMAAIVTGHPELVRPPTPTPTPGPSPVAPR